MFNRVGASVFFLMLTTLGNVALAAEMPIDSLQLEGLGSTHEDTIVELLPRATPAVYTDREIAEFSRRIKNLALFDSVKVETVGRVLSVRVRRKTTISPIVDFSSGKTLRDSKFTLGATENDVDGRATRLGGKASYTERGLNVAAWINQHPYGPRRWMNEAEIYYAGSGFRSEDTTQKWQRNRFGGFFEFLSPFLYGSHFRYEMQIEVYRETFTFVDGPATALPPASGTFVGTDMEFIWDQYTWNDLTPNGFRLNFQVRPGVFWGANQARHEVRFKALGALKLGEATALVGAISAGAVNGGNVNHSVLIGSQNAVRGLPDSLYRTRLQSYATIELRHALSLGKRWYVQGVLFGDTAVFEPMDLAGKPLPWSNALATGAGIRILPTALVDTLLRLDVSRLLAPTQSWFYQIGITQYI